MNVVTKTATREKPVFFSGTVEDELPWITLFDPKSKRNYYYNRETKETTWQNPYKKGEGNGPKQEKPESK